MLLAAEKQHLRKGTWIELSDGMSKCNEPLTRKNFYRSSVCFAFVEFRRYLCLFCATWGKQSAPQWGWACRWPPDLIVLLEVCSRLQWCWPPDLRWFAWIRIVASTCIPKKWIPLSIFSNKLNNGAAIHRNQAIGHLKCYISSFHHHYSDKHSNHTHLILFTWSA